MKSPVKLFYNFRLQLVAWAMLFSACSSDAVIEKWPMVNELKPGAKFRIRLPENHSKGETWRLTNGFDEQVAKKRGVTWHGDDKGVVYYFEAGATGQTTLNLELLKYTEINDERSFIVKIQSQ